MCSQQKAQANGQTVAEPQQEIKVTEEKKKPPPSPAPAPVQPPADTKVVPHRSIHSGFIEEVYWFVYIFIVTITVVVFTFGSDFSLLCSSSE